MLRASAKGSPMRAERAAAGEGDVTSPCTAAPARVPNTSKEGGSKKILAFDSWTGGSFNLERLLPALERRGMTLRLVHIGSGGSDRGRPAAEFLGSLEARDVSFYGSRSFAEILDLEQPDAVIMLSTQTFAHRAFLRYCRQRGIPTLHLYHGLSNVQVTNDRRGSHRIDRRAYAKYVVLNLGKLITRTFPCYMAALFRTGASGNDWLRFFSDVVRMARGRPSLVAAADARTTKGAVYTNADVEHAMRIYGFDEADVVIVGNPDLMRFGLTPAMIGSKNSRATSDLEWVMYIDTALSIVGLLFKSNDAFVEHLIQTSGALRKQGKRLAFKPHPAHDLQYLTERLKGTGIDIVANDRFVQKLQDCCACIAETTSVAVVPALLGMPLLLASYGELRDQRFGPVLTSYPRGYILDDPSRLADILAHDADELDASRVDDWIAFNAGPLPSADMPHRVAQAVERLIAGRDEARA